MEIIKTGNPYKQKVLDFYLKKCYKCKTEFKYTYEDISRHYLSDDTVQCPFCNERLIHRELFVKKVYKEVIRGNENDCN